MILSLAGMSQDPMSRQKIDAARIALITERLDLTQEQAEKFWPIYNEYSRRQRELRQEFITERQKHDISSATEEENKRLLEMGMRIKEQSVQLEREYSDRMLNVITTRQLMSLRKAEEDFKQMLLQRVRERQQHQQQMQQNRRQNEERMRQRKNN